MKKYIRFPFALILFFFLQAASPVLAQEIAEATALAVANVPLETSQKTEDSGISVWLGAPIPLSQYSEEQIAMQKAINQQFASEYVLSFNHAADELLFSEDNYSLPIEKRLVDNEDITPFNWRWVSFEMKDAQGNTLIADLRRPNWWIQFHDAGEIGNLAYLSLPEMAIEGLATVTGLHPSYVDTRVPTFEAKRAYSYRPITGWFERTAGDVWDFVFSSGDTIGATANHPFFSEDRQAYVPVGEMRIGERVKLKDGIGYLSAKINRALETERVYNLEVWREHNYLVGNEGVLVHNACPRIRKNLNPPSEFQDWMDDFDTQLNPRRNFEDGEFERFATGDDVQHRAQSGADRIWVDGYEIDRNALIDAKDNRGSYFTLESYLEKPFMYNSLEGEFERYAAIIDDISNPAVELIIRISLDNESSVRLFEYLGLKFNVPTTVELMPWTPDPD